MPPAVVVDDVTYGKVPKSRSSIAALAPEGTPGLHTQRPHAGEQTTTFRDDALARVVRFVDVVNTIDDHIVRKQTLAQVTDAGDVRTHVTTGPRLPSAANYVQLKLLINVVVKVIQALMGL